MNVIDDIQTWAILHQFLPTREYFIKKLKSSIFNYIITNATWGVVHHLKHFCLNGEIEELYL